jgi:hypothetical protein
MSFEFYCPNGHLLEGDDEQLGTQGRCPICGTLFRFPTTTLVARREKLRHDAKLRDDEGKSEAAEPELPPEPVVPERRIIQVLCPRGHVLNILEELLGSEAVCLKCKTRFTPTVERSVPYLRTKHRYETQKGESQGRFWMGVAVLGVTAVVTAFVVAAVYLQRVRG